ncbi:MAG: ABC transporter ATP-binding protein [Bdellovibrionales bacterium]
MPGTPLMSFKNVSVRFSEHTVLSRVNLDLFEGESLVIIGPSGQGKSVLLKLFAGLMEPTEGEVLWSGRSSTSYSRAERVNWLQKMGMLFQKNALFDSLSVAENVAFPLRETTAKGEKEIQALVDYYLEAVGLLESKGKYPSEISGGMQKRLGIARALALKPKVILYDDPTAGLDPITSRKIIQLILNLQKELKSTIITITNEMNRAFQLAGRICMVVDESVIEMGDSQASKKHQDPRVQQFIRGNVSGPLTDQR